VRRRAGVLVELALVCLLGYIFIAIIMTFGQLFYSGQVVQQAADIAARELARTPLPANITFEDAMLEPVVQEQIFSTDWLVIDLSGQAANQTLFEFLDTLDLPVVNQALVPVMFTQDIGGAPHLRYPGALVNSPTAPSGLTVEIPVVVSRDTTTDGMGGNDEGTETIRWAPVVEEVGDDPFQISSPEGGLVVLRVNLPYQSAAMTSTRAERGFDNPTYGFPNVANDGGVTEQNAPSGALFEDPDTPVTYDGPYGLGRNFARGSPANPNAQWRPYRKLLTAQVVARREVFE